MTALALLQALGAEVAFNTVLQLVLIYFLVVHVVLGLLGDCVRALIKMLFRRAWQLARAQQE